MKQFYECREEWSVILQMFVAEFPTMKQRMTQIGDKSADPNGPDVIWPVSRIGMTDCHAICRWTIHCSVLIT